LSGEFLGLYGNNDVYIFSGEFIGLYGNNDGIKGNDLISRNGVLINSDASMIDIHLPYKPMNSPEKIYSSLLPYKPRNSPDKILVCLFHLLLTYLKTISKIFACPF
jgi:hypothetical protein